MITYEMLPLEDWNKLEPLYTELFPYSVFPGPEVSCASVAKDGDKIIGFWFLQMVAHAEPVGIDPEYSGQVSLPLLRETLHKAFQDRPGMEYYIVAPDPQWDEALRAHGFEPMGLLYVSRIPKVGD